MGSTQKQPGFTIENGIIEGEKYLYPHDGCLNFGEFLLEKMKKNPNFVAQVDSTTEVQDTFESIINRSVRLALWLKDQNLQPGDVIGICMNKQINTIVPCLASLYTGHIFYPWRDYTRDKMNEEIRFALGLSKAKVLFIIDEFAEMAKEIAIELRVNVNIVIFSDRPGFESFDEIIGKQKEKEVQEFRCTKIPNTKHPAMIIYTSGSTGNPKGTLHSHESLFGNVGFIGQCLGDCNTAVWYSRLSWISGIRNTLSCLAYMKKHVLVNEFTAKEFAEIVQKYKIDWVWITPHKASSLVTSRVFSKYDMSSIKYFSMGASIVSETTQKAIIEALPKARVVKRYGSSETGGTVILQTDYVNIKPLGTIVKNMKMKIVDPKTGKTLGANEIGEGCIKSPFMMTEYYNDPLNTKRAIDPEGWLHTTDLFCYDKNGSIYFCGRLSMMIKVKNHDVSPEVIEQQILKHSEVYDCGVIGVATSDGYELPIACVVKSPNTYIMENDITDYVEEKLPEQMWLKAGVIFLDEVPRTISGKVNRTQLRKIVNAHLANHNGNKQH